MYLEFINEIFILLYFILCLHIAHYVFVLGSNLFQEFLPVEALEDVGIALVYGGLTLLNNFS